MSAPPPRLSLVIPVFNEEENLEPLFAEIRAALDPGAVTCPYEVLFVDDGSTDSSPRVLERIAAGAAPAVVRILRQGRNAGQSAAFDAGFRHARAPVVVTLDADLQNDPADIPALLAAMDRSAADVVCGVRVQRADSWVRRASSRLANGIRNRLTRESIRDVGCSLKAYRAEYLRRIPMFQGMHRFLPTLLRRAGARVVELPVSHRPRRHGVAKYGIGNRAWRALVDLFAVRWMLRRWIDPTITHEIDPRPRGADRAVEGPPRA